MTLDLRLTKEELRVNERGDFAMPIHPWLLSMGVHIPRRLSYEVLPQAFEEWKDDLAAFCEEHPSATWLQEAYLDKHPRLLGEPGRKVISGTGFQPRALTKNNGFVWLFELNRDPGGMLYYRADHDEPHSGFLASEEKRAAYTNQGRAGPHYYSHHNIDNAAAALLHRNWALYWQNAALEALAQQHLKTTGGSF